MRKLTGKEAIEAALDTVLAPQLELITIGFRSRQLLQLTGTGEAVEEDLPALDEEGTVRDGDGTVRVEDVTDAAEEWTMVDRPNPNAKPAAPVDVSDTCVCAPKEPPEEVLSPAEARAQAWSKSREAAALGAQAMQQQETAVALAHYTKGVEALSKIPLDETDPIFVCTLLNMQAGCHLQRADLWEAVFCCSSALSVGHDRIDPTNNVIAIARQTRAEAYSLMGLLELAKADLDYLMKVCSDNAHKAEIGCNPTEVREELEKVDARLKDVEKGAPAIGKELGRLSQALAHKALGERALVNVKEISRASNVICKVCSKEKGRSALRGDGVIDDELPEPPASDAQIVLAAHRAVYRSALNLADEQISAALDIRLRDGKLLLPNRRV